MNDEKYKYETDFLLQKNNFLIGFGSVLNLAGSYFDYNYSKSALEADKKALMSDWINIGSDISKALQKFRKEYSKKN